jgi:hypothetical protein
MELIKRTWGRLRFWWLYVFRMRIAILAWHIGMFLVRKSQNHQNRYIMGNRVLERYQPPVENRYF